MANLFAVTWLKDGRIPAHSVCPFTIMCDIAKGDACHHNGIEHDRDFSCALARGFDMVKKSYKDKKVV